MTFSLENIFCSELKGVGPKIFPKLKNLAIDTVYDLLLHLPFRYQDRSKITPLGFLIPEQAIAVVGEIIDFQVIKGRKTFYLFTLKDGSGSLKIRFFHLARFQYQTLTKAKFLYCFGETKWVGKSLEMIHPEYKILNSPEEVPHFNTLTPIYPSSEGLSQFLWRKITEQALDLLRTGSLSESLPQEILAKFSFPGLIDALHDLHRPPLATDLLAIENKTHPSLLRLIFEELLAHHLSLLQLREKTQAQKSFPLPPAKDFAEKFISSLPFKLTLAQEKVIKEIGHDLAQEKPMLRLLQGEVGSGKTIVAAMAILQTITNQKQAAIMAPTEILAEQHYQTLTSWLAPLGFHLTCLTGKVLGKARNEILEEINSGKASVVIGTHAIFQEKIKFKNLALVIIDEQHRFGVHQRLSLSEKGKVKNFFPHQLIMTATPIPRTLTMALYADLDCSIIDQLPKARQPITTSIISSQRRPEVIAKINNFCQAGKQVFWVCSLIEESENFDCEAATKTAEMLKEKLPFLKIGLLHGKMSSKEKDTIVTNFKNKKIDLLVSTTVIEVGIDIPAAALMVIENAERMGLVQLHQLRGRVGRGKEKGFCILMYEMPLSFTAKKRLTILKNCHNGFVIAEKDLELRGPGELLGTKQTGLPNLKIADLARDAKLFPTINQTAKILLAQQSAMIPLLIERWVEGKEKYGRV